MENFYEYKTSNKNNIYEIFPIGSLVISNQYSNICKPNDIGIVIDHYNRTWDFNSKNGISILFLNREYDGFSEKDLALFEIEPIGLVFHEYKKCELVNPNLLSMAIVLGKFNSFFNLNNEFTKNALIEHHLLTKNNYKIINSENIKNKLKL